MISTCKVCGKNIDQERSTKLYCSDKCRAKKFRKERKKRFDLSQKMAKKMAEKHPTLFDNIYWNIKAGENK